MHSVSDRGYIQVVQPHMWDEDKERNQRSIESFPRRGTLQQLVKECSQAASTAQTPPFTGGRVQTDLCKQGLILA